MKKITAFFCVIAAVGLLASCSSTPKQPKEEKAAERIELVSTDKVETLEHKGTGLGVEKLPQWLAVYMDRGIPAIEAMADYKGKYCIVADERGPQLQQLITWVNNFNAQQQIGATISTRIESVFKAHETKKPDGEDSTRKFDNAINAVISANYTGAAKQSDWWIKQKITGEGHDPEIRYTAYVLYAIDKKILDNQIGTQVEKIGRENPELDAVLNDISAQILTSGLVWEDQY